MSRFMRPLLPDGRFHLRTDTLRFLRFAILIGLAIISAPRPTLGQVDSDYSFCLGNCNTSCGPASSPGHAGCYSDCLDRCERMRKARQQRLPPAPYGAIAFGDQGAEGMAWNQESDAGADNVALNYCGRKGANCKIIYRFQNTCGALAKSEDDRHAETATGPTKEQAEASAIAACRRWGKCSSDLSACSYADRHVPSPPSRTISWGAIAFSAADGQAGWSRSKDDRASAEKEALSACSQRGKACVVLTAFNKQCGALVRDGSSYGWSVAADQPAAMQQARQTCERNGGRRCVPQVLFCSR